MKWSLINAKNGQLTIEIKQKEQTITIHSRYNPEREAARWGQRIEIKENTSKIYVIGMGLGYHIEVLRKKFPQTTIEVWDFNNRFKWWVETTARVRDTLSQNVRYKSSEEINEINNELLEEVKKPNVELIIHKPSLHLIPTKLIFLREKLEDIHFIKQSYFNKKDLLQINFENNMLLKDNGINGQLKIYRDKSFLLVSAGPSLTKQLPMIKKIRQSSKAIIGCVGTALKPLLLESIVPDFVMVTDPLDNIYQQINGVDASNLTLFYLSSANHKTVSGFAGKRYIVWQNEFTLAKKEAEFRGEPIIETGGSVATSLLDLMVKMGASTIGLVGQDLAYTDWNSHASSATGYRCIDKETTIYEVNNYDLTGKVPTSKNLTIYLKWFESYIKQNKSVELFNCTEGGAHIKGWKHISLQSFFEHITR